MNKKAPNTAEEYFEVFRDYMEMLQSGFLEWGFGLSIAEQIDVFQYHFIDQWEKE